MPITRLPPDLLEALWTAAGATRWRGTRATFGAAIEAAAARRFGSMGAPPGELRAFAHSLHLADLALACACRDGDEAAWEFLVSEHRPALQTAARGLARDGSAGELADSLFAELFSIGEAGERRSLLGYYHGRARLGSWLRTVLVQRYVDRYRAARRTVSIDDTRVPADDRQAPDTDPHREDYLRFAQQALDAAIARLSPDERLRLRLYYGGPMTLAQIGRLLGEHEATVSRKLERSRRTLRRAVEEQLEASGLAPEAVAACLEAARSAPEIDASRLLAEEPD